MKMQKNMRKITKSKHNYIGTTYNILSNIFSEGKKVVFGNGGMLYESTADTLLLKLSKHTFYYDSTLDEIIVKNGYLLERYRMVSQTEKRIELLSEEGDALVLTR